jgi:hypothetical protein
MSGGTSSVAFRRLGPSASRRATMAEYELDYPSNTVILWDGRFPAVALV